MKLTDLYTFNKFSIKEAGPKYSPGIAEGAPNIEINELVEFLDALCLNENFKLAFKTINNELTNISIYHSRIVNGLFLNNKHTPATLSKSLSKVIQSRTTENLEAELSHAKRAYTFISRKISNRLKAVRKIAREREPNNTRDSEYERLQSEISALREYSLVSNKLKVFFAGDYEQVIFAQNHILLTGEWGTGKTHFLCDMALRYEKLGLPVLLVLANNLKTVNDPFAEISNLVKIEKNSSAFLKNLNKIAKQKKVRALILLDAINESDRKYWHRNMKFIINTLKAYKNLRLVVSCRTPFEEQIINQSTQRKFTKINHMGFQDNEFNAQIEFFKHYEIPLSFVPLLVPEFTKPLTLKMLCEDLKDYSTPWQKRKLKILISGQRGMTTILENYIVKKGGEIEKKFSLPTKSCWFFIKGKGSNLDLCIAARMASQSKSWLKRDEVQQIAQQFFAFNNDESSAFVASLIEGGILKEELKWEPNKFVEAITFPYQRFGDHIIARHLMNNYLNLESDIHISRSFYRNRVLGKLFYSEFNNYSVSEPGLITAIMLELPERLKKRKGKSELFAFLPKDVLRRKNALLNQLFISGLSWRSTDAITEETEDKIHILLKTDDTYIKNLCFTTLVGLCLRVNHKLSSKWLWDYLINLSMQDRDLLWSEFLRDYQGVESIEQVFSWCEIKKHEFDKETVLLLVNVLSLVLTSSNRHLRDAATKQIVLLGDHQPEVIFGHILKCIEVEDVYISERMIAAGYGIAMRWWGKADNQSLRKQICNLAISIVDRVFSDDCEKSVLHSLVCSYSRGLINIAAQIDPSSLEIQTRVIDSQTNSTLCSPFPKRSSIRNNIEEVVSDAIRMDFANYTLGKLVPDRRNYDFSDNRYIGLKKQIAKRMRDLGYDREIFQSIDDEIGRFHTGYYQDEKPSRIDRYGKKYSWITYYEMFEVLHRQDRLGLDELQLTDLDIDPSFPDVPISWMPKLQVYRDDGIKKKNEWLVRGKSPFHTNLLCKQIVDNYRGPWILLDAFIDLDGDAKRNTISFINTILVGKESRDTVICGLLKRDYLGNGSITVDDDDHYVFAGEVPWSTKFASHLRDASGGAIRKTKELRFDHNDQNVIHVDVPVHSVNWEDYHSSVSTGRSYTTLAPHLSQLLISIQSRDL